MAIAADDRVRPEAGSITILALWVVAIVATLLAGVVAISRSTIEASGNAITGTEARLAADAGTQLGILHLLHRRATGVMVFDGTPEEWRDGLADVQIAIVDEAGKIDVNEAPLELLKGLFTAIGEPDPQALQLACNVVKWRGDLGALCPEADKLNPNHQRFLVPEQLAQVPGIDEPIYDKLADYVTVVTRAAAIDPLVAARRVLLALPGASPALVDAFIASRRNGDHLMASASGIGFSGVVPFVTMSPAQEFTISAVARISDRAAYRSDLLIRLTGTPKSPYVVLGRRAPPVHRGAMLTAAAARVP